MPIIYRCRFTAPRQSDWSTVEADSPELAANELHDRDPKTYAIGYEPEPDKPGRRVYFASVEVEGHGEWVSRMYTSSIVRRGGVKSRRAVTLAEIARAIGWQHDPAELLAAGWDGEESVWR